jgi:hypothetical protein
MNRSIVALVVALGIVPVAGLAQDTNSAPAPTADQRQAMRQTFQQFAQQAEQLHQQMRSQILSSLSPVHLREVAATIGNLAIEQNPDPQAAAKRLDQILSPGERQRILAAHASFAQQSLQLHEQMRTQLQSEMPAGHSNWMNHGPENGAMSQRTQFDAGTVLLMALSPHPMLGMMGMDHGPGMMHMEGAPPR